MKSKCFNVLHKLKREMKYFVFDIETWGLEATPQSFALGIIYGKDYYYETTDVEEMRKTLLSNIFDNSILFAHNALFDLTGIFGNIVTELDERTVFNNSTFILSKFNSTTFADSYNVLPAKLENIGKLLGKPKGITPEKFKKAKRSAITKNDIKYCLQDCKIVYEALGNLFQEVGCVRITLASLAMAYFRRKYLKENIFYNDRVYDFFDSYYGGRVECFRIGKVYAQKFDINSMYPHAMKYCKFPNPAKLSAAGEVSLKKLKFYLEYYEGMAEITVRHRPHYYGFLPYKTKTKLLFPVGTFSGCWNFPEIRFALENKVIEIIDVKRIIYAPAMESPFADFVTDLYNKRKTSTNEFEKYLYKIILNSLYGKFAQKKKFKTKYVSDVTNMFIPEGAKIIPLSTKRNDAYIVEEELYYSYNTIPVFSSYITSFARVNLLQKMVRYIDNDIVYIDTDSIAVNNYTKDIETSNLLGDFKLEEKIIVDIIGNKSYREKGGNLVMKGVRKDAKQLLNGKFTYKRMIKPKGAIRTGAQAGTFIDVTKSVNYKYDKRKVFADGSTKPLEVNEHFENLFPKGL